MPVLALTENPDILKTIATGPNRPTLVMGFAAETSDIQKHAGEKLARKGADYIVANDVSPKTGVMGGDANTVTLLTKAGADSSNVELWPTMGKQDVAAKLIARLAADLPK